MKCYFLADKYMTFFDALKLLTENKPKTLVMRHDEDEVCFYIDEDKALTLYDFENHEITELGSELTIDIMCAGGWKVYRVVDSNKESISLEI